MSSDRNIYASASEHEKSKNNMNLTRFRPWLTEMDRFIFPGRNACIGSQSLFEKASIHFYLPAVPVAVVQSRF